MVQFSPIKYFISDHMARITNSFGTRQVPCAFDYARHLKFQVHVVVYNSQWGTT